MWSALSPSFMHPGCNYALFTSPVITLWNFSFSRKHDARAFRALNLWLVSGPHAMHDKSPVNVGRGIAVANKVDNGKMKRTG